MKKFEGDTKESALAGLHRQGDFEHVRAELATTAAKPVLECARMGANAVLGNERCKFRGNACNICVYSGCACNNGGEQRFDRWSITRCARLPREQVDIHIGCSRAVLHIKRVLLQSQSPAIHSSSCAFVLLLAVDRLKCAAIRDDHKLPAKKVRTEQAKSPDDTQAFQI